MSDSVTGNLPWRPGGIIEHCSPSVGRGPADKVPPRVRFPPLSKSAFFPPSSSPPLALISWSVSVLCFSNFSKSIACKMCRRYLSIQYGSFKIFLGIYFICFGNFPCPCPMSQYLPPSASLPFPVHHTEDRSQPSLIRRLGRLEEREVLKTDEAGDRDDQRPHREITTAHSILSLQHLWNISVKC